MGILVDEKGAPIKARVVKLFMVVEGSAKDAFGAPLKSAFTVAPNKQILDFPLFDVKTETDTTGAFSLEVPQYLLVPSGVKLTGYTLVVEEGSSGLRVLRIGGEMATIVPAPDSKKIELGKLSISPQVVGGK